MGRASGPMRLFDRVDSLTGAGNVVYCGAVTGSADGAVWGNVIVCRPTLSSSSSTRLMTWTASYAAHLQLAPSSLASSSWRGCPTKRSLPTDATVRITAA